MTARRSTFPLFGSDDGWPYPDLDEDAAELARRGMVDDEPVDLDALELSADRHAFDALTPEERACVEMRFGRGASMKTVARELGCTHTAAATVLGSAIDKLRTRISLEA
ncbi:MAG TPA: sigma factor-like helix-turn-helix DNA-binding protein [Acidimicrobiia bacterium]|jgi:DNA-directed RNA polymerase specialized sigma24 family protein